MSASSHELADDAAVIASPPSALVRQPVTLLALVCRCLDAASLLAASRTCRALNAAASHPLTYQHDVGISVSFDAGAWVSGPSATFRHGAVLLAALQSPLMRHFRIIHLKPWYVEDLEAMLRVLHTLPADHPLQLHVLVLHATSMQIREGARVYMPKDRDSDGDSDSEERSAPAAAFAALSPESLQQLAQRPLYDLSQLPCTRYLKSLLLICDNDDAEVLLRYALPPTLELLQLTISSQPSPSRFLSISLPERVRSAELPHLRQLLLLPGRMSSRIYHPREDMQILQRVLAAAPHIDVLMWKMMVGLADLLNDQREAGEALPCVRRVQEIDCADFGDLLHPTIAMAGEAGQTLHATFPDLRRLHFHGAQHMYAWTSDSMQSPLWPRALSAALLELSISTSYLRWEAMGESILQMLTTLAAAQLVALQHLTFSSDTEGITDTDTPPASPSLADKVGVMLTSMPLLTYLSMSMFNVQELTCFRHAPKLLQLHGITWPYTAYQCNPAHFDSLRVKQLYPDFSLASCFPSLQSLHVKEAPCRRFEARHLLLSIPTLTSVAWRSEATVAPSDIVRAEEAWLQACAQWASEEKRSYMAALQAGGMEAVAAEASWAAAQDEVYGGRNPQSVDERATWVRQTRARHLKRTLELRGILAWQVDDLLKTSWPTLRAEIPEPQSTDDTATLSEEFYRLALSRESDARFSGFDMSAYVEADKIASAPFVFAASASASLGFDASSTPAFVFGGSSAAASSSAASIAASSSDAFAPPDATQFVFAPVTESSTASGLLSPSADAAAPVFSFGSPSHARKSAAGGRRSRGR